MQSGSQRWRCGHSESGCQGWRAYSSPPQHSRAAFHTLPPIFRLLRRLLCALLPFSLVVASSADAICSGLDFLHTVCVFCPCVHHSFLRTSAAFSLFLLETFRFLHFPLLVHPSAQARLGVFPGFWWLYLAVPAACSWCRFSCLLPLLSEGTLWEAKQNSTPVPCLPPVSPKPGALSP